METSATGRDLEDRIALIELSARAARTFDDCDPDGYAACFVSGALYESPKIGLRTEGLAELQAMCLRRGGQDIHILSNFEIEISGDEATVRCFLLLCAREGAIVNTTGRYENRCVRTPGGWRYKHKVSILDRRG